MTLNSTFYDEKDQTLRYGIYNSVHRPFETTRLNTTEVGEESIKFSTMMHRTMDHFNSVK